MGKRCRRARRGFTLLELTIALAVVMIAVLATATTQASAVNLSRSSRDTAQATSDLASAMEEILLNPASQIPALFPPGQSVPRFNGAHMTNEQIVATYPGWAGGPVPDPLIIRLTVTWVDKTGRQRTSTLSSARTQ